MLKQLNRTIIHAPRPKERILQFGGGNFLRCFVDWIIHRYNQQAARPLGVIVVKTTTRGDYEAWKRQDGLYHVRIKGIDGGTLVDKTERIECITRIVHIHQDWDAYLATAELPDLRYIISNTTESGIRLNAADRVDDDPPQEFPAKLTRWLYQRYQHFEGNASAGCILLPCELLEANGDALRDAVLEQADAWRLERGFARWIKSANGFCNTLVDRIVPGIQKNRLPEAWESLGFKDEMVTEGEPYHLWAIQAPETIRQEWPLDQIGLNVVYTDDLTPYRTRKVRILNGAHTSMVPVGYLAGVESVREAVEHPVIGAFIRAILFEEVIPSMDGPAADLERYAEDILDRFRNPYINHRLLSISLNSISKFKVRVLPSLLRFYDLSGRLPRRLVIAFACLIRFYQGSWQGTSIPLNDGQEELEFMRLVWGDCDGSEEDVRLMVEQILAKNEWWNQDLRKVKGLEAAISSVLFMIEKEGIFSCIKT